MHRFLKKIFKKIFYTDPVKKLKKMGLVVGCNFNIKKEVIIDWSHCWHIKIGDNVTLAPRVHILAHDASTKMHLGYARIGKVSIGNRVFVGTSSIIMPGVTIGDDVVIGAGSIVTKDIPDNSVAVGSPAKVICKLNEYVAIRQKEIETFPCFSEEYTVHMGITPAMKEEMNNRISCFGYVE